MAERKHYRLDDDTESIEFCQLCQKHSGVCTDIINIKEGQARMENTNKEEHAAIWKGIDTMKTWVIIASGSLLLEVVVIILNKVFK